MDKFTEARNEVDRVLKEFRISNYEIDMDFDGEKSLTITFNGKSVLCEIMIWEDGEVHIDAKDDYDEYEFKDLYKVEEFINKQMTKGEEV